MIKKIIQPFIIIYILLIASISFCLTVLPASILALPFSREKKLVIVNHPWRLFSLSCLKLAFFCKVKIEDHRPVELQKKRIHPGLFIGNHSSFVDIPLFLNFLRIPPIMKKSVLYYPIFGICAYASGAIFVDRTNKSSRKKVLEMAVKLLTEKVGALQYYPEGTRQRNGNTPKDISKIKTTLMQIAFDKNIPIYTFAFHGTSKALGTNVMDIKLGQQLSVIFRDKLDPQNFESKEEFIEAAWKQVQNDYQTLDARLN